MEEKGKKGDCENGPGTRKRGNTLRQVGKAGGEKKPKTRREYAKKEC